ncbi:MAG: DctP family TRAP transporter solute-binding subunit [Alphaproteobacteria bacterium]|nr:DctP family TRAP transporter solute-binding subunit [Alphaproteobacteria bacterium]
MKRVLSVFLPAMMLLISGPVFAEQVLKAGHVLAPGSQFGAAITAMNEVLQKELGGKIRIQEYPASALGAGGAMLKNVELGTQDILISSAGGALGDFNPPVGILDLMLLFRDNAHAYAVLDGPIGKELLDTFKDKGMVGLAWAENGFRHLTNSKHPIRVPDDLKGIKIRLSESTIYKDAFKTLGAEPFSLPFAQVYQALQSGQADAQENPITTIVSAKLQDVQKFFTFSNHTYAPAAILINKEIFEEFDPATQAALRKAAVAGAVASREFVRKSDEAGLAKLKESGVAINTDFDRAAFEKALEPFYQSYSKQFPMDKIMAIKNTKS